MRAAAGCKNFYRTHGFVYLPSLNPAKTSAQLLLLHTFTAVRLLDGRPPSSAASADRVGGAAAAAREAERHALENERLRSQLLFYATAPLGRAAAKGRGGARSKSAHSLTMPLPPV